MVSLMVPTYRQPPPIYRAARALRWTSTIVFVFLIIFAGTVAYSAVQIASSSIQSHGLSASFVSNGSIEVSGSITVSNPGLYPVSSLSLTARVSNGTGVFIGKDRTGPVTVSPDSTSVIPLSLYLPLSESGAAASLLTTDQDLYVYGWTNATYAYIFPISLTLNETRYWGAPFEFFRAIVGTPSGGAGGVTIPVTIAFFDNAQIADDGSLSFIVESSASVACGGATFPIDVGPGTGFYETENTTLSSGCSPVGGTVVSTYTSGGVAFALPPETIP